MTTTERSQGCVRVGEHQKGMLGVDREVVGTPQVRGTVIREPWQRWQQESWEGGLLGSAVPQREVSTLSQAPEDTDLSWNYIFNFLSGT